MTQEMLFSKYAEQYPLTVPQEAVENELQLLILEEKQRIQYAVSYTHLTLPTICSV